MKAKFLILSVLAAGAAFLFGCTKEPATGYDSSAFKLNTSYVQIDTLGGESKITLKATEDWKLYVRTSYEYKDADGKTKTVDTLIVPGTSVKPRGIKDAVESWITASPLEGAAGEHEITFTAPAGSQYRTQDVRIVGESGSAVVTLAQGEDIVITYKASQARDLILAGKHSGSPVLVKGIICKIDDISTSYGNATYYISDDGTFKGGYDENDPSKNDGNWLEVYRGYWLDGEKFTKGDEIAVGDAVTIKAVLTLYKGIPETNQNTAEIVEITKSLVAVSPANVDVLADGGIVEVAALYTGDNLTFDIDTAGVKFLSIIGSYEKEDTTFVKIRVDENEGISGRTGVVSFTSSKPNSKDPKKKDSSTATVTIRQGVHAAKSVAELAAVFNSDSEAPFAAEFADPAVVTYVNGSNIFFSDATGGILYFKAKDDTNEYAPGTTISGEFTGKGKLYSALPELTLITGGKLGTADVPAPKVVTLSELNTNFSKYLSLPVKIEGVTIKGTADGSGKVNIAVVQNDVEMILRTQVKTIKLNDGAVGDITVIPTVYNTTKQLGIWSEDLFEASAPIKIDGDFADWASIEAVATGSRLAAVKALSDGTNLYLYQKWNNSECHYASWSSYQFLYFDTDNNAETGSTSSSDFRKGTELYWKFFFHFELSNASYNGYNLSEYCVWDGTAFTAGTFAAGQVFSGAESADYYECEYSIPLANLSLTAGSKCKIGILGYTHDTSDADKEFRNALFEVQL